MLYFYVISFSLVIVVISIFARYLSFNFITFTFEFFIGDVSLDNFTLFLPLMLLAIVAVIINKLN